MSIAPAPVGRRERNKQQKLDRIIAAAAELFALRGVDDVTTQEIADRADIGTGTLFLYAKTKGELLLLVQNAHYRAALEEGRAQAAIARDVLDAVMAIVAPVVACNRTQIDNGRTYLREMAFGDPAEPHHAAALAIVEQTQDAVRTILTRDNRTSVGTADTLARVVSALMFVAMAAGSNVALDAEAVTALIREDIAALLPR